MRKGGFTGTHALAALALLMACGAARGASPPVELKVADEAAPLAGHIDVLRDDSRDWTIDDVKSPTIARQFTSSGETWFHRGTSADVWWYRLALRAPAGVDTSDWVLQVGMSVLDKVDIHLTRADGTTETILTGDTRQPPPQQISWGPFAEVLHIAPGEEIVLHVRAETEGRNQVYFQVASLEGYYRNTRSWLLWLGWYHGILLTMALYNLLVFLRIRDRAYLLYVFMTLFWTAQGFLLTGLAMSLLNALGPAVPGLVNTATLLCGPFTLSSTLLFAMEFLQTRLRTPRMHRALWAMVLLHLAIPAVFPLVGVKPLIISGFLLSIFASLLLLAVAWYLVRRGFREARLFFVAWAATIVGSALWSLESLGGQGKLFALVSQYSPAAAYCIALALFSLALADRIQQERAEKTLASERAARLNTFLPRKVAELVVAGDSALLEPKRREVTVCVIDLRGFTPFSETSPPEDVMAALREFYDAMGRLAEAHGGTVEHFAGDSMLIFFNAPLEIAGPEKQAIECALEMRAAFEPLRAKWRKLGHELGLGIGIADGYATIGAIGFAGRSQYAAIGAVTNLAARLCSLAQHGEILATPRVLAPVEALAQHESAGPQAIKGFTKPVEVVRVLGLSATAA